MGSRRSGAHVALDALFFQEINGHRENSSGGAVYCGSQPGAILDDEFVVNRHSPVVRTSFGPVIVKWLQSHRDVRCSAYCIPSDPVKIF